MASSSASISLQPRGTFNATTGITNMGINVYIEFPYLGMNSVYSCLTAGSYFYVLTGVTYTFRVGDYLILDVLNIQNPFIKLENLAGSGTFLGTWDASTNTPTLSNSSVGANGDYYVNIATGTNSVDFGAGSISFAQNDKVISTGTAWINGGSTSGSISLVESTDGTILVTNGSGPTTNLAVNVGVASGDILQAGVSGLPAIGGSLVTALNGSAIATGTVAVARLPVGSSSVKGILQVDGTTITETGGVISAVGGGSGGVSTVSVVSTNGFTGTVANPTSTPAITLTTSVTGIIKGNGTALSTAVATDFPLAISNTTQGTVIVGSNITNTSGTISIPQSVATNADTTFNTVTAATFTGSLVGNGSAVTSLNATNISSGTLGAARLPTPTTTTLGGNFLSTEIQLSISTTLTTIQLPQNTITVITNTSGSAINITLPGSYIYTSTSLGNSTTILSLPANASVSLEYQGVNSVSIIGITSSSSGSGGITSINGNTTAAQVIASGAGILVSSTSGTTTITNNNTVFSILGGAMPRFAGSSGGTIVLPWIGGSNPVIDGCYFYANSNWSCNLSNISGITSTTNVSVSMSANVFAGQAFTGTQGFQVSYNVYAVANNTLISIATGSSNSATLTTSPGLINLFFTSTPATVGFSCTQLLVVFNATSAPSTGLNTVIPCFDFNVTLS